MNRRNALKTMLVGAVAAVTGAVVAARNRYPFFGTRTYRMSCSTPNLSSLPRSNNLGMDALMRYIDEYARQVDGLRIKVVGQAKTGKSTVARRMQDVLLHQGALLADDDGLVVRNQQTAKVANYIKMYRGDPCVLRASVNGREIPIINVEESHIHPEIGELWGSTDAYDDIIVLMCVVEGKRYAIVIKNRYGPLDSFVV